MSLSEEHDGASVGAGLAVDVVGLTKSYRESATLALDRFDLRVAPGEMVAIMGASGSGKTTLLNLIAALDRPDSGRLHVFGQDLSGRMDAARYRARDVGVVFQSFNLFPAFTALENVLIPMYEGDVPRSDRIDRARELLEYMGLGGGADHRVRTLSQGQQQRVAIARSLANGPRLLLADEPTGNLDSTTSRHVMEYLERIHRERGMTVLLVTHDAEVADRADRIARIVDGRNP